MDRETGEVLSAKNFEPVTWANGYDLKTGLPDVNQSKQTHFGVYAKGICPSSTGGKEFVPSSFSPRTGLLYIPAHNTCMDYEGTAVNYIAGTPYLGASVRMYPGPGGYQGELIAWDVAQAKKVWSIKEADLPVYSGVLSTGGDLVFYGTMDGWFRAIDAHSGKVIAIYAGIGGWMGAAALPSVSTDDPYAALGAVGTMAKIKSKTQPGDLLYVFSL